MQFSKSALVASQLAWVLALSSGNALANGGTTGTGSASGDSDAGETGAGDPGDFSSAWFVAPLPNASFEVAPAILDAEIGVHQGTSDGGIMTIELFVDDVSIGSQDCVDACTFSEIELAQGVHLLRLEADSGYGTSTMVYVDEEIPNNNDDCGTSTGVTGGTDGDTGDGGGGGCSVNTEQLPPWGMLAIPGLLLVPVVRRRRRTTTS